MPCSGGNENTVNECINKINQQLQNLQARFDELDKYLASVAFVGVGVRVTGSVNITIDRTILMQAPLHGTVSRVIGSTMTTVLDIVNMRKTRHPRCYVKYMIESPIHGT